MVYGVSSLRWVPFAGVVVGLAGCGSQYRPIVSAINPVGPAGQPTKYVVAVASVPTNATYPGLVTFVDVSGDTVLSTPSLTSSPTYYALNSSGSVAYAINKNTSYYADFATTNPQTILTANVGVTTLPAASSPVSLTALSPLNASTEVFVAESATNRLAVLNGNTQVLLNEIALPGSPVYTVGIDGTSRVYTITSGGQVAAIETATNSVSSNIAVGTNPVYGVMSGDGRRAFILNKGSGTVSVINVVNNALDATTPTITLPNTPSGVAPNPVWAVYNSATTELFVLNQGDGVHAGSVTVINVPLCTNSAQVTNPACNSSNPVDATNFGQVLANIPVGVNPSMLDVLKDGSKAYVINGGAAGAEGSVSVVDGTSFTVTSTIQGISTTAGTATATTSPTLVYGHPNSITVTSGSPTGKVYVTSGDNQYMTVIYTNTDTVQVHIPLQGLGVRALVTAQ